jgi:5'-3' exonuclease
VARERPLVHLIDGAVYVFRAYHSLPPMHAPDGTPTNAAYGFAGTLIKYLAEQAPTHVGVAFDHSQQSFRNRIEPAYKAQRGDPPEDLEPQFDLCVRVARALGVASFAVEDYEADDLIASLVRGVLEDGARVRVVTTDKDLAQVVREDGRVTLFDLARGVLLDAGAVREKFGVDPAQIPDWLGLVGDAVDNLPGVPGVGPVGAAAALRAFGRIEDIPADPARWEPLRVRGGSRIGQRVDAHRERALRTRELATLVHDVPGLEARLPALRYAGADRREVETLFVSLGWGRIATRIPRWA